MAQSFDQLAVGLAMLSLGVVMPIIVTRRSFFSGFAGAFYALQVLDQKASCKFR